MKKITSVWLILLIAISINVFFRMRPAFLSFTKSFAKKDVTASLIKEAHNLIDMKFKDLPLPAKTRATQQLVNIWEKEKRKSIDEVILKKQKELKSNWQDEWGRTYLLEIDPYHWLRLVNNLLRYGRIGDKTVNGVQYDSFMLAPSGMKVETSLERNLHVYISYYLFKLARIFDRDLSLIHFVFYMPVLISTIALIFAFLLCLSINKDDGSIAGFFAVISLGLSRIFLGRSLAGWFDTDTYVILFSLLSAWMFYLSLDYASGRIKRSLFALLSGLSIGLFAFSWDGWWYVFDLMVISALLYIFNLYINKRESAGNDIRLDIPLRSLGIFILSSLLFVGVFAGLAAVNKFISGPISISFAKGYLQNQFWPNTFLTVDELMGDNLRGVLERGGGPIVILCGLCYLVILLLDKKSKGYKQRQFIAFYFTVWTMLMMYVSLKARRFSLLLVIPAALSFGLAAEWVVNGLDRIIRHFIKKPFINIRVVLFVVLCAISLPFFVKKAFSTSRAVPEINRSWWNVLEKIRIESPEDTIVNSWWDFGHWFKAVANRPVIFDGATQNTPMAYWMARCFLSDNEKEAMGILRMLNSGSNKAFEELENLGIDRYKSLEILNKIIVLEEDAADRVLSEFIAKKEDRKRILKYTHHPRNAYFIVEPSLIQKMRSISFLANWNFVKADIYQKFRELEREEFVAYLIKEHKYNEKDAVALANFLALTSVEDALLWISSPRKYIGRFAPNQEAGNFVFFKDGFAVDIKDHSAYVSASVDGEWRIPKSLFYLDGGVIKENDLGKNTLDFSLLLIPNKDKYTLLALDGVLAKCMLTRLYYMPELKYRYFKPVITEELKDNKGRIIVYRMNWEGDE